MAYYPRFNSLSQLLDIAGSETKNAVKVLTDEPAGLGQALASQTGSAASITAKVGGIVTVDDLTGMTANSVGNFLSLSNTNSGGNTGTFLIVQYVDATSVKISNSGGVSPDTKNGEIVWVERAAYALSDDLDCERTDRAAIKGVDYYAAVPVYQRPTNTDLDVPANLTNIAGKTTDARGFIINRRFAAATVAASNTLITITSTGNLKHSDSDDKTGIPCFDAAPYTSDYTACFVDIQNPADGTSLNVLGGGHIGEKIFAVSQGGSSTSPNTVEIKFYSVPYGGDITTDATAYTWESGQPTSIDLFYGYFQRLDQIPENTFRLMQTLGISESGDLRQDITDILTIIGAADGDTSIGGDLTNTGDEYVFSDLPSGTPTIVEIFNTINAQIGDRTYTGAPYITDGEPIATSLAALANAISGISITRAIMRRVAPISANSSVEIPGGLAYTLDSGNDGKNLWVFWRGILRDPGTVVNGDDYAETDTTHITPYVKINAGDHINFFVMT